MPGIAANTSNTSAKILVLLKISFIKKLCWISRSLLFMTRLSKLNAFPKEMHRTSKSPSVITYWGTKYAKAEHVNNFGTLASCI